MVVKKKKKHAQARLQDGWGHDAGDVHSRDKRLLVPIQGGFRGGGHGKEWAIE